MVLNIYDLDHFNRFMFKILLLSLASLAEALPSISTNNYH